MNKLMEAVRILKRAYPAPEIALNFNTPFELLVATILSAQTTDALVNKVTERLFKKYRSVKDYADASVETLREDINSVNFYRTKAGNIKESAKIIIGRFKSAVPRTIEDLVSLPGVARKTANIVLSGAYGINEGIAVDTHVKRVSLRLGFTEKEDPVRIEEDLMALAPKKEWGNLSHLLILHGRRVCRAKNPLHQACALYDICPSRDL